jgi:hypothetical protein
MIVVVATVAQAAPAAAQEVADASCPGPATTNRTFGPVSGAGNNRWAQTFTAQHTGTLTTVDFGVYNSGSAADWVVQILPVTAGVPVNGVLSSSSFASPTNPVTGAVIAHPLPPVAVTAGRQYALALTRPGSDTLGVATVPGDPCPGDLFVSGAPPDVFSPEGSDNEWVFQAFVTLPAPATASQPRRRCKKGFRLKKVKTKSGKKKRKCVRKKRHHR